MTVEMNISCLNNVYSIVSDIIYSLPSPLRLMKCITLLTVNEFIYPHVQVVKSSYTETTSWTLIHSNNFVDLMNIYTESRVIALIAKHPC